MSDHDARQQWPKLTSDLPPARVNTDKTEILYPRRRTVTAENARTREEVLTASQKAKNNPSAEDWAEQMENMGRGHEAFEDHSWATALGLGKDALECVPSGQFSKALPDKQMPTAQERQTAADEEQEKREMLMLKKLSKPFDALGQTSKIQPATC